MKRLARAGCTVAVATMVLGMVFLSWPLPASWVRPWLEDAERSQGITIAVGSMSWRPATGFRAERIALGDSWPHFEGEVVEADYPWGKTGWVLRARRGMLRVGRDTEGVIRWPWRTRGPVDSKSVSEIHAEQIRMEWADRPLDCTGMIRILAARLDRARGSGDMEAVWETIVIGRGQAVGLRAPPFTSAGSRNPGSEAVAHPSADLVLMASWRGGGETLAIAARAADDTWPFATFLRQRADSGYAMEGSARLFDLALDLKGRQRPGGWRIEVEGSGPESEWVHGNYEVRHRDGNTSMAWSARAERLDGRLGDPFLGGVELQGRFDLDARWDDVPGRGTGSIRSAGGRIYNAPPFARLAARTGIDRLRHPRFTLLDARVGRERGTWNVRHLVFEGEGLGLRFAGTIAERSIQGTLICFFSDDLVSRIPALRDAAIWLDRERGRTRVVLRVTGSRDHPVLTPVLPPRPLMVIRGLGRIIAGGVGRVTRPVVNLGEELFGAQ